MREGGREEASEEGGREAEKEGGEEGEREERRHRSQRPGARRPEDRTERACHRLRGHHGRAPGLSKVRNNLCWHRKGLHRLLASSTNDTDIT